MSREDKEKLLLTDEEIDKAFREAHYQDCPRMVQLKALCQAQLNKILNQPWPDKPDSEAYAKALVSWLFGTCPHSIGDFHDTDDAVTHCYRHACGLCMQELRLSL